MATVRPIVTGVRTAKSMPPPTNLTSTSNPTSTPHSWPTRSSTRSHIRTRYAQRHNHRLSKQTLQHTPYYTYSTNENARTNTHSCVCDRCEWFERSTTVCVHNRPSAIRCLSSVATQVLYCGCSPPQERIDSEQRRRQSRLWRRRRRGGRWWWRRRQRRWIVRARFSDALLLQANVVARPMSSKWRTDTIAVALSGLFRKKVMAKFVISDLSNMHRKILKYIRRE